MNAAPHDHHPAERSAHSHLDSCEKFCVFSRRGSVFAILAVSVREVGLRPKVAQVPMADAIFAGLAHVRNEFLPLVRLPVVTRNVTLESTDESQMVVLNGEQGPWGLLVDRVFGLVPLDVSLSTERSALVEWQAAVMGTAAWEHHVVQVLDERALYRSIVECLSEKTTVGDRWSRSSPVTDHAPAVGAPLAMTAT